MWRKQDRVPYSYVPRVSVEGRRNMEKKFVDAPTNSAGIATKNELESILVDNDDDLKNIVSELMRIRMNSEKAAVLSLKWETKKTVEIIRDIGDKITDVDRRDMEFKHGFDSLLYLLEQYTNDKILDDDVSRAIYFVFEFSFLSIATDVDPVFDLIYLGELRNQAVGLSVIGEGIAEGARRVLAHDNDDDFGDDDCDNDDDENDYIKRIKKLHEKSEQLCRCR